MDFVLGFVQGRTVRQLLGLRPADRQLDGGLLKAECGESHPEWNLRPPRLLRERQMDFHRLLKAE
jgi:hypothetical protein